ncbi:hypothetical protein LOAG_08599 [Loa loa]|uniref:Uncharacterized protein n=1 Tax=Loa loa TaxID=7209 RepID=A0A1S0TTJ1_LOALO|nr:hypothetical protein LOAG_08599 [Loa loa]EFO19892.1 hypothetical protein LOAG_08599 [Loa loa]
METAFDDCSKLRDYPSKGSISVCRIKKKVYRMSNKLLSQQSPDHANLIPTQSEPQTSLLQSFPAACRARPISSSLSRLVRKENISSSLFYPVLFIQDWREEVQKHKTG